MSFYRTTMPSALGPLVLLATDVGLRAVQFACEPPGRVALGTAREAPDHALLRAAARELAEYFAGQRRGFAVALDVRGTDFQRRVWRAAGAIPFGQTRSYGALARELGRPDASRAVGAALGRNPLCIVVPCHRVVGSSGELTGFAGGLAAKRALLALECHGAGPGARPGPDGGQLDLWQPRPEP